VSKVNDGKYNGRPTVVDYIVSGKAGQWWRDNPAKV